MRWWGLYTQRRPGIDGGRTATLEPRGAGRRVLHAPGPDRRRRGHLGAAAHARRHLHRVRAAARRTSPTGRTSSTTGSGSRTCRRSGQRAGGGRPASRPRRAATPRGSSSARRWPASPPTRSSTARRRSRRSSAASSATRSWPTCRASSRPRSAAARTRTSRTRSTTSRSSACEHPEHGPGFDLWVGGGLSTNPMLGQRLGAWVPLEEVPEVWHGVVQVFRDYGYRRLRTRARIKFLVADWGAGEVPRGAGEGVPRPRAARRPAAPAAADRPARPRRRPPAARRPVLRRRRAGRRPGQRRDCSAGSPTPPSGPAATGSGSRPEQKIVVLDVAAPQVADLLDDLDAIGLTARASAFRRGTMACTGIEFCKLAIVETKATARRPGRRAGVAVRRRPGAVHPGRAGLTINLNGCPNSCARAQVADIGLKGMQLPNPRDPDGPTVEGFQIHLGGGARRARRVRPQAARAQDHQRGPAGLRRAASSAAGWSSASDGRGVRHLGRPGRRGRPAMSDAGAARRRHRRSAPCPTTARSAREEDLRPVEQRRGGPCLACLRVFSVAFHGLPGPPRQHCPARARPRVRATSTPGGQQMIGPLTSRPRTSPPRSRTTRSASPRGRRRCSRAPTRSPCSAGPAARSARRLAVTASMGDTVLAHLASRAVPGVNVLFVDTGYHFAETIGTADAVAATYPVRMLTIRPKETRAEHEAAPRRAVAHRPRRLLRAAQGRAAGQRAARLPAWATGLRRDDSPDAGRHPDGRAGTPSAACSSSRRSPPGRDDDVEAYLDAHPDVLLEPAAAARLPLDRLRAVHPRRSRPARTPGPAAGPGGPRRSAASTAEPPLTRHSRPCPPPGDSMPAMRLPQLPSRASVVVIGGGVIGLSTAYHLAGGAARRGPDRAGPARRRLDLQGRRRRPGAVLRPGEHRAGARSLRPSSASSESFGQEIDLHHVGYLLLLDRPQDVALFERSVALQREFGLATS